MTDTFDPQDIRILSDILALVLDEQTGQASGALEKLRARARRNRLTGGALKNLFVSLASDEQRMGASPRIDTLERERRALMNELNQYSARIRLLQSHLAQSQRDSQVLRNDAAMTRSQQGWRMAATAIALFVGIFVGTAMTSVYHTLTAVPPCDRASYLR